jgi:hypothetical protein
MKPITVSKKISPNSLEGKEERKKLMERKKIACKAVREIKEDDPQKLAEILQDFDIASFSTEKDEDGWSILFQVIHYGQVKCLQFLIDRGVDIDATDSLFRAFNSFRDGSLNCAMLLLENDVDMHHRQEDDDGEDLPIQALLRHPFSRIVEFLDIMIEKGYDLKSDAPGALIGRLLENCGYDEEEETIKVIDYLTEKGYREKQPKDLLVENCLGLKMTRKLIELGADVNAFQYGESVLLRFIKKPHPPLDIIEFLLREGANKNRLVDENSRCAIKKENQFENLPLGIQELLNRY